jgi:N-acetylneuraminic acid mutarotase
MVYDPASGRVIMFGHPEPSDPFGLEYPYINDMWAYDPAANTWTELKPSGTVPSAMGWPAYDPTSKRVITFGGSDRPATQMPDGGWYYPNSADIWAYDPAANTWTELKPSGVVPPPRMPAIWAYDPVTQRMILFGGRDDARGPDANLLTDTWAYDPVANTWTELKPSGTVPVAMGSMACDPSTGLIIMFGLYDYTGLRNDTWAYDPSSTTWTDLDPKGTLPTARYACTMAYDSSSQRVIMFGGSVADGSKYFDDTWVYDPATNTWTELNPSETPPSARCGGPLVYVPSTGQVLMFGGVAAGVKTVLNDTWAFTP